MSLGEELVQKERERGTHRENKRDGNAKNSPTDQIGDNKCNFLCHFIALYSQTNIPTCSHSHIYYNIFVCKSVLYFLFQPHTHFNEIAFLYCVKMLCHFAIIPFIECESVPSNMQGKKDKQILSGVLQKKMIFCCLRYFYTENG